MRILLVEDQQDAAEVLKKGLREQGYAVDHALDGEEADFKASVNRYDLIVLDLMLPGKSGFALCQDLRNAGNDVPILILSARDAVDDRIRGLLRRRSKGRKEVLRVGDLSIEVETRKVQRAGRPIELTAKEFALLEYLARNAGQKVTRTQISREVWDESYDSFSNLIEIYLGRLRKKIDSGHDVRLLHTIRGEGYMLSPEPASICHSGSDA